jgi:hypothetical protein
MEDKMVIENLKQIKDILCKIPDNLLEKLGFGMGEGAEEDISLIGLDEDFSEIFDKVEEVCPEYHSVVKYIENVGKAQSILEEQDELSEKITERLYENAETITDVFFDKVEDEKSSPNQNKQKSVDSVYPEQEVKQ